jgi:low temperature requirement protein LtrA
MSGFMMIGLLLTIPLFLESVSLRSKIAVVATIIAYQETTWALTLSPWLKKKLKLTYSTAVDITHEIDRMAAFFIIILGEFLYSIVVGAPTNVGITPAYAKAVCTLIIAFSLNWLYVSGDGSQQAEHPIRRSAWTAFAFFLLHLPLAASFLIGGHLCAVSVTLHEFEKDGQRWLLAGGLAVGMFCLWIYAQLYKCQDDRQALAMPKQLRVAPRFVVAVVLAVLPKSHQHLNAADFVGIVTGLFAFILVWETVGGLSREWSFVESWKELESSDEDARDEL